MNIYSFETLDVRFQLMQEEEIPNISASEPQIKKVRILYSLKKFICGPGAEIWPLSGFSCISL